MRQLTISAVALCLIISIQGFSQSGPPKIESKSNLEEITEVKPSDELFFLSSKINRPDRSDAYPFLSADGLRLYLTMPHKDKEFGGICLATREHLSQPFGTPIPLKNLPDPFYCATLTSDECTMYLGNSGDIYVSTRKNINSDFSKPRQVSEFDEGWCFAPAVSPDGTELLLIVNDKKNTQDALVHYKKNEQGFFKQIMEYRFGEKGDPGPGQFSKDGNSFYFSLELIEDNKKEKLYTMTRPAKGETFTNPESMDLDIEGNFHYSQPTASEDGSVLAFIFSPGDTWHANDILIIENRSAFLKSKLLEFENEKNVPIVRSLLQMNARPILNADINQIEFFNPAPGMYEATVLVKPLSISVEDELQFSPNPASTFVNIRPQAPLNGRWVLEIYNNAGALQYKQAVTGKNPVQVAIHNWPGGIYSCRLISIENKTVLKGRFSKVSL